MSDVSAYTILPAASPDATPLVDLTIYDLDATALFAQAVANASVNFPDWNPQAGNTEVVILQAQALMEAELSYAINRLPLAVLQGLAGLFNVQQELGLPPTGTITITCSDTLGHLIPSGTTISYTPYGQGTYYFTTDFDLAIVAGTSSGSVTMTCTTANSALNGTAVGTVMTVISPPAPIINVVTDTALAGGADPETTQAWLTRAAGVLQASTNTLVLPTQFQQAAVNTEGVWRANVLDNFEPYYTSQWGASSGASVLGEVTMGVYGQGQVPVTTPIKQTLQSSLESTCVAGLGVNLIDACITTVSASVSAVAAAGWAPTDVTNSIMSALTGWLTTDQWPWGRHVRILDGYKLASTAPGVDYVSSFLLGTTTPGASVVSGASVGSPITLQNPVNLLPTSPDSQSFEDGSTGNWGASVGWQLFWPLGQGSYSQAASVSNSTTWAATGTHSLEIQYSNSLSASTNPSLWVTNASLNIPTLASKTYTISCAVNFGGNASLLNTAYANQLVWLVTDTVGNQYQAAVSMAVSGNIATFLGTFSTSADAGNINSMTLFLMAGYGSTPGWVNGPIYLDNIGLWQGAPAAAIGVSGSTNAVDGFTYNSEPNIISGFVAGDVLLGGINRLSLATLNTSATYVQVAAAAASQQ